MGTPGHYAMRNYSCWCDACSRVRGRGHGAESRGAQLRCRRSQLTVWTEDKFTVRPAAGIRVVVTIVLRANRVSELLAKAPSKVKPNVWGRVQVRNLWLTEEE